MPKLIQDEFTDLDIDPKRKYEKRKWLKMTADERAEYHLKKRYKITLEQWKEMFELQDHKCKTCGSEISSVTGNNDKTRGVVDHCHTTGKIRGLLCHHCNRALGLIKDDKNILKNLIKYLEDNE